MANVKTLAKELDFRTGGTTRCQKLMGGMPPDATRATRSNGGPGKHFPSCFVRLENSLCSQNHVYQTWIIGNNKKTSFVWVVC